MSQATIVRRWLGPLLPWLYLATVVFSAGACIGWLWCEEIFGWWVAPFRELLASDDVRRRFSDQELEVGLIAHSVQAKVVALSGGLALLPFGFYALWHGLTRGSPGVARHFSVLYVLSASAVFATWTWLSWHFIGLLLRFLVVQLDPGPGPFMPIGLPTTDDYLGGTVRIVFHLAPILEFPVLLVCLLLARVVNAEDLRRSAGLAVLGSVGLAHLIYPWGLIGQVPVVFAVLLPYGAVTFGAFLLTRRNKLPASRLL